MGAQEIAHLAPAGLGEVLRPEIARGRDLNAARAQALGLGQ